MIIFKSLLTTFEANIIFWGSWSNFDDLFKALLRTINKFYSVQFVQIFETLYRK